MRKQNLLKLALVSLAMFVFTGAWAQIDLTVRNADGTLANGAVIYTISSSDATDLTVIATDGGAGDNDATVNGVINFTPVVGTNYIVRNATPDAWNTVTFTAVAAQTVYVNSSFALAIQEFRAGYEGDKVTINKAMPYWVYPSPVHNPAWSAPAAYADGAAIATGIASSFGWTATGLDVSAVTTNYVELTFTTTGVKTLTVEETASAAFGGCAAPVRAFTVTAINPPYVKVANAASNPQGYFLSVAGDMHVVATGCEGAVALDDVNITLDRSDNILDEYPYYIKLNYTVYPNSSINTGTGQVTLGVAGTVPAANMVTGDITPANIVSATNPLILNGTAPKVWDGSEQYNLFTAPGVTFGTLLNSITVYEFDITGWNALISRKSDYVAFRGAAGAGYGTWDDAKYTFYNTAATPATDNLKAYVVVLPTPATGPIYHIPNSWGDL